MKIIMNLGTNVDWTRDYSCPVTCFVTGQVHLTLHSNMGLTSRTLSLRMSLPGVVSVCTFDLTAVL